MLANDIYIGIDGGGTKSRVRIEDAAGHLLGQAVGGPANIRLSVEGSWKAIHQILVDALNPLGISLNDKTYRFHAGLGLAGCEVTEAFQTFINIPHPFTTLKAVSDAHVACQGAHGGGDGAIIIVGTGVVGYQIEAGKDVKIGGWGFPHDDEGGGAWLGMEATRLAFQWLDHRTEKSPLVEDIFDFFKNDLDYFVSWANRANSSEFARLAPLVINHSQREEIAAVRLMKKAAQAVDKIGQGLHKLQAGENDLPCCLFGGIAPFLESWLSQSLRSRLVARKADASQGALFMIRQHVSAYAK